MIMITHDLGIVADLADKVIVMYGGKIMESAKIKDLFKKPSHPYTLGLLRSLPKLGSRVEKLIPIEGSPINLLDPPAGCPFAPRCEKCMKICLTHMPPEFKVEENHNSACWLLHEKGDRSALRQLT